MIGEDIIVARLRGLVRPLRKGFGIGDDCAAVPGPGKGEWLLLKSDCVVETRHFRPADSARAVGWKAVSRAVSDIAACGGRPASALVTCVLRAGMEGRWLMDLYRGMEKAARVHGFHIVGGELARTAGPAMISVAMTGHVAKRNFISRSGGKAGDALYVTGVLGRSLDSGHHLRFRPRLEEACWLAGKFRVHAMMDLSDGLASDLPRLAAASGTGFVIDPGALPLRRGATAAQAMSDGEDFELLFAIGARDAARLETTWAARFPRVPLNRIGKLARCGLAEGLAGARGYDHFSK